MSFLAAIPLIGDIFTGAKELISESITDKDKKNELTAAIDKLEIQFRENELQRGHEQLMAQAQINVEEAKSKSLFVAGARPFITWVCGFSLAFNFIGHPMLIWLMTTIGLWYPEASSIAIPEPFDMTVMLPVLLGILGLGGYRTVEKIKGVNNK